MEEECLTYKVGVRVINTNVNHGDCSTFTDALTVEIVTLDKKMKPSRDMA